ncbi:hypothetical protein Q9233_012138 [Columba guinea]|nr:hypothetical protein Q9233_012138 [Columba guinea]
MQSTDTNVCGTTSSEQNVQRCASVTRLDPESDEADVECVQLHGRLQNLEDESPVCSLIPAAGPSPHRTPQLLLWRDLLIHLIPQAKDLQTVGPQRQAKPDSKEKLIFYFSGSSAIKDTLRTDESISASYSPTSTFLFILVTSKDKSFLFSALLISPHSPPTVKLNVTLKYI